MDIIAKINLALRKRKEEVVLDLYLKDYEHSNYYFALVFNKKIDMFKMLFVPLDLVDSISKVSEYFCYQFIYLNQVEHILSTMNNNKHVFNDSKIIDRKTNEFDSYYVEINYYDKDKYTFKFSQYIDREYLFLFDIVALFFEYLPHIVSEMCMKLLEDFNDNSVCIKYNILTDFDLYNGKLDEFDNSGELSFEDIKYLELINNRYYAFISNNVVAINYIRGKEIFNISSIFPLYSNEHLIIIKAIREEKYKHFPKFIYDGVLHVCYCISNGKFKSIGRDDIDVEDNCVKFINMNDDLKIEIEEYLNSKYSKKEVRQIYNNLIEK